MTTKYNTVSLTTLTTTLEEVTETYRKKIMVIAEMFPNQKDPTWDGRRYHAPSNNYQFDGRSYAAGEYLHDPDVAGSGSVKTKVLVDASSVNQIKEVLFDFHVEVGAGKSWTENDGTESCYLYLEGPGRIVNAVTRLAPIGGQKALVLADEGFDTGKTWETTIGRIKQRYFCDYDLSSFIPISDALTEKVYNWALKEKKGRKTEKVKVGFHYQKKTRICDF